MAPGCRHGSQCLGIGTFPCFGDESDRPRLVVFPGEAEFSCERISAASPTLASGLGEEEALPTLVHYPTAWLGDSGAKGRAIGNQSLTAANR